jgi:hypothetical protein
VDDRNHVYPLLFACKTLGIPSLGYQFGMAGRYQQGYVLEGWEPEDGYQWYDRDVLWGAYWEEVVRRWSKVYPPGYFLMGANKTTYSYKRVDSADFHPRNVLVPYEIWGNTKRIGEYIKRMIDLGYTVHFKYRPTRTGPSSSIPTTWATMPPGSCPWSGSPTNSWAASTSWPGP